MSEGPIKKWRDSWKPPTVSTNPRHAVHAPSISARAYCGRNDASLTVTPDPSAVTCADCLAATRADEPHSPAAG